MVTIMSGWILEDKKEENESCPFFTEIVSLKFHFYHAHHSHQILPAKLTRPTKWIRRLKGNSSNDLPVIYFYILDLL